jgi:NADH-quinone oxidoreductase subunit H
VTPELKGYLLLAVVRIVALFTALNVGVMLVIWVERRVSGFIQDRLGPNRVGPAGLLQSVADGVKNIMKEETFPSQAERVLFLLAPTMSFVPAMLLFAVIPVASPLPVSFDVTLPLLGRFLYHGPMTMAVADVPVGFLLILAFSSLGVYGIVLAGWSSNSKYAFLGGLRASAQMISYEIALGMSVVVVLILAGNVTLADVIRAQQASVWFVAALTLGFVLFMVSAFAETNRLPFDLPEAEAELITGYHTEYSSMRFSFFFIAEYTALITMSGLMTTLFFGGWDVPFTTWDEGEPSVLRTLVTLGSFTLKTGFFIFTYIWVRWTLPRFRYDQLMALGWKFMLPTALGYIMLVAVAVWALDSAGVAFGFGYGLVLLALNAAVLYLLFWVVDRGRLFGEAGLQRGRGA